MDNKLNSNLHDNLKIDISESGQDVTNSIEAFNKNLNRMDKYLNSKNDSTTNPNINISNSKILTSLKASSEFENINDSSSSNPMGNNRYNLKINNNISKNSVSYKKLADPSSDLLCQKLQQKIDTLNYENYVLNKKNKDLLSKNEELKLNLASINHAKETELQIINDELSNVQKQFKRKEEDNIILKEKIKQYNQDISELSKIKKNIFELKSENEKLINNQKKLNETIINSEKNLDFYKNKYNDVSSKYEILKKEKEYMNKNSFSEKEKNKELNILYSEIEKIRNEYDYKKNMFMKDFHNRFQIFSLEQSNILSEKLNEKNEINKGEKKIRNNNERKKTKKEITNHIKHLEFIKRNKMYSITNEMKKGLENISNEYQLKIKELDDKKEKLEKEINMMSQELNYYKKINEELLREHQIYYLDILKKGKDCRKEGLVWVVKNLLELQMNLEYHHFPQCLTHEQINYLKKLAFLILEENELKIILKILKRKQKDNRENVTIEYMNFFDTIANFTISKNKNKLFQNKVLKKETVNYDEQTLIVKRQIDKKFYKIYQNNEEAFKLYLAKSLEDEKMQNIIYYIKKALYNENNTFLKDNKISIIEAFMGKTKNKDFFGLILNITNRLHEIEKSKISITNKEKEYYMERIKNNPGINSDSLDYFNNKEMIKKCLFGNKLDI
jgi:hypothetical protein